VNVAIFYGTSHGDTGEVAKDLAKEFGAALGREVPAMDVCKIGVKELTRYDVLLLGCSTWNVGEMQDDWDRKCDDLDTIDLSGRLFAVFGTGDHDTYSDTFVDALGMLAERVEARGAQLFGMWPTDGYRFDDSRALRDGKFVGLPLDFENQWDLTAPRLTTWTAQLVTELNALRSTPA
jgi:flavodoxin I